MLDVSKDVDNADEKKEPSIPCFRCGICCSRYQVGMSPAEAQRIADELGISWEKFIEGYTDRRWPGTKSFLLCQSRGTCVFLKSDEGSNNTSCLIHPFRPSSCREWTASQYRPECQEGLYKYWGIKVNPGGKLQGTKVRMQRFQSFLRSLDNKQI